MHDRVLESRTNRGLAADLRGSVIVCGSVTQPGLKFSVRQGSRNLTCCQVEQLAPNNKSSTIEEHRLRCHTITCHMCNRCYMYDADHRSFLCTKDLV
ncbi:hypothetical protein RRG08_000576 [Elysia crispata]|uniref:Uncharacterized protein n=1 Tax=Elysia crispata TaxID=231223 RepID=A0AAE0Y8Q6_9GAST|nr:hypothetical protein RRG08_000576 [Elysia crispata]